MAVHHMKTVFINMDWTKLAEVGVERRNLFFFFLNLGENESENELLFGRPNV